jgi:hypothetical protein
MHGATYVSDSGNSKIGGTRKVDGTYASIKATCPDTCSLKGDGSCYAMNSRVGMYVAKLNKRARSASPLKVARAEAQAIDEAYNGKQIPAGRDLRLHVAGDSRTIKGTRLINKAVSRWKGRGGNDAWSYTHAWRHVPRSEWSDVSVLASIDYIKEAPLARKQGYAPAIVVAKHLSNKTYLLPKSKVKWIPCPAQTKAGVSCVSCRLCFDSNRLYKNNMGIAFEAHGIKKNDLKKRLNVIQ